MSTNLTATAIDVENCTLSTCPLELANIDYVPNLAGNVFYVAIFALFLVVQLVQAYLYRTVGFSIGMFCGLLLEIIGYVGRIQMHFNPFTQAPFLTYLICLTIAPAFLSAAVYLCLARIIVACGESLARFRPRTYTIIFMFSDFFALVLQGAGGGLADSTDNSTAQTGINIMIAGLSWQVFSLLVFIVLSLDYAWSVRRNAHLARPALVGDVVRTKRFKWFIHGLALATLCIFTRSVFRVAELSEGFNGSLANNQVSFMILEGAMIVIACICLTLLHPGMAFQGKWAEMNFKLRSRRSGGKDTGFVLEESSQVRLDT